MNKGSVRVDFAKTSCTRLSRFSYVPASTPTQMNPCGNVPVRCTCCPKGSSTVWKYNIEAHCHAKHSPALPPAELMVMDFELEGLKVLWDSRHTANRTETRCRKQHRPNFSISKANSTCLALHTTDMEDPSSHQNIEDQGSSAQQNHESTLTPYLLILMYHHLQLPCHSQCHHCCHHPQTLFPQALCCS